MARCGSVGFWRRVPLLVLLAFLTVPSALAAPRDARLDVPVAKRGDGAGNSRKIELGVYCYSDCFLALTGQRSLSRHLIVGWGQGLSFGGSFEKLFASMGALPLFGISANNAISPGQIARGSGDGYLVGLNRAIA